MSRTEAYLEMETLERKRVDSAPGLYSNSPMNRKSRPILRAFGLFWARMGSARIYVLSAAGVIVFLAAVGLGALFSTGAERSADPVRKSAPANQGPMKVPSTRSNGAIPQDPLVSITRIVPRKKTLRDGSTSVVVNIGVAPRPNTRGDVLIRVGFFDLDENNEMRPTDAQVDYNWLTQVRDWGDPAPKYLQATCVRPPMARGTRERVRYGGCIVRVYLNDQLQDERSDPKEILTALRGARESAVIAGAVPVRQPALAPVSASSASEETPTSEKSPTLAAVAPSPELATREGASTAPYASPVPGKPGFVYSPHDRKFIIDVRGAPPGSEITDPNTGKPLRVP